MKFSPKVPPAEEVALLSFLHPNWLSLAETSARFASALCVAVDVRGLRTIRKTLVLPTKPGDARITGASSDNIQLDTALVSELLGLSFDSQAGDYDDSSSDYEHPAALPDTVKPRLEIAPRIVTPWSISRLRLASMTL